MLRKQTIKLLPATIPLLALPFIAEAKKIRQVHKMEITRAEKRSQRETGGKTGRILPDSLLADRIRFSGYDKPVSTSKETFHVTNLSDTLIRKVGIRISYLDLQNRMLHSREADVECDVPKGETRIVSINSWDKQHTFYYYLGPEPKKTATPYKVSISLLWVEF